MMVYSGFVVSRVESNQIFYGIKNFPLCIEKEKRQGTFIMSMMPKIWIVDEISIRIEMERG